MPGTLGCAARCATGLDGGICKKTFLESVWQFMVGCGGVLEPLYAFSFEENDIGATERGIETGLRSLKSCNSGFSIENSDGARMVLGKSPSYICERASANMLCCPGM